MPLVRISLKEGRSPTEKAAIGEAVHQAMIETITVPAEDRFQIFTEHGVEAPLVADRKYLGIDRTEHVVIIQITLNRGRTLEQKRALYRAIADRMARNPGIRKEDVFVSLVEVGKEDWSFGNGEMSYVKP
ncbi:MAG TPA: tautomerase family protein [Thermoanaerobaculia bacterium]|nr:tautomerase family protein [Thermoanaerobaculia bacterium]